MVILAVRRGYGETVRALRFLRLIALRRREARAGARAVKGCERIERHALDVASNAPFAEA